MVRRNPAPIFSTALRNPTIFEMNDYINAQEFGASAKTDGDTVVTNNFTLDTGQRDNYYDISRIVRKPGVPAPTGKLLVVFDYFEHVLRKLFKT